MGQLGKCSANVFGYLGSFIPNYHFTLGDNNVFAIR